MGKLYVVATPIGNLDDITIRAVKILLSVGVIACEDTRHTGILIKLLKDKYGGIFNFQFSIKKFLSVRDWNEVEMVNRILSELVNGDVALVSDAGTPLISDPGFKVVRAVREAGFEVVPIPGPSAVTAALSAAGLPTDKFVFWGFLGKKWSLVTGMTNVIYESPTRLEKTLGEIESRYPRAKIVVASEITKVHERFVKPVIGEKFKGEVTILVYPE